MYAGVACGCCMGHMVVILEHTPIPTLSPYFFHQFIPTFYLIFFKFLYVLVKIIDGDCVGGTVIILLAKLFSV